MEGKKVKYLSTKNFPELSKDQSVSHESPDFHLVLNKLEGLAALTYIFIIHPN